MPHREPERYHMVGLRFNTVAIWSEGLDYIEILTQYPRMSTSLPWKNLGQSGPTVAQWLVILDIVWFRVDDTRGAKAYL